MKKWTVFTLFSLCILTVANCRDNRIGQSCTTQSGTPGSFQYRLSCPTLQNNSKGSKTASIVCCPHQTFTRSITVRRKTTTRKIKRRKGRASTPAPDPYSSVCGRPSVGLKRKSRSTYDDESSAEYYDSSDNITDSDIDYSQEFNMTTSMVVGGSQATPHSWPWMAALIERAVFSSRMKTFCGGTLISNLHILCAAHCVRVGRRVRNDFAVRLGGHGLNDGTTYAIGRVHVHSSYRNYYNDISVIRLRSSVAFTTHIIPICLPTPAIASSSLVGKVVVATGWGVTKAGGAQSKQLRQVNVIVTSSTECDRSYSALYRRKNVIIASQICANAPGKDTCQGDSGGPLQYLFNGAWYQVGITSFGQGCAHKSYPGVYTKVGTYVSWIKGIISLG